MPPSCLPFVGKPVSPMIQAVTGPPRSIILGSTQSRTLAISTSSNEAPAPLNAAAPDAWLRPALAPSPPPEAAQRDPHGQSPRSEPRHSFGFLHLIHDGREKRGAEATLAADFLACTHQGAATGTILEHVYRRMAAHYVGLAE